MVAAHASYASRLSTLLAPSLPQEAGVGRYCPHLLADYLVLAAAPPSGKSKALLRFHSPARALAVASGGGSSAATSAPAVEAAGPGASGAAGAQASTAAAEEEVLAGEPMGREAAAALRQGAYALYGACSPAEVSEERTVWCPCDAVGCLGGAQQCYWWPLLALDCSTCWWQCT